MTARRYNDQLRRRTGRGDASRFFMPGRGASNDLDAARAATRGRASLSPCSGAGRMPCHGTPTARLRAVAARAGPSYPPRPVRAVAGAWGPRGAYATDGGRARLASGGRHAGRGDTYTATNGRGAARGAVHPIQRRGRGASDGARGRGGAGASLVTGRAAASVGC